MEVHAHTHTARKKWTHYFWEFLMLFLAVFCGFLAENKREHMIEHQREKKLARSLVNDIIADTLRLHAIIEARTEKGWMMDSLSSILNAGPPYDSTNTIYYYAVFAPRTILYRFIPNEGTLDQLKNAGGLRLIQKGFIADSITKYDASIRSLLRQQDLEESAMGDYRNISHRFFDGRVFNRMMNPDNIPSLPTGNPPLISFSKADLTEFNYKLFVVQAQNRVNRRECRRLLTQANNLLIILKEEYHQSERTLLEK
ncbi:MAG: hypothetical protein IPQ06_15795 [Chitinophagaceae bacterium]|nr:hypothetical protein [Chitinophagaceae bacterium]MBL0274466.1 hypothetical protein [Chitinophagaceae bacterium]